MISSTTGLYVVVRRLCGPAQTDRISSEMGCHSQPYHSLTIASPEREQQGEGVSGASAPTEEMETTA